MEKMAAYTIAEVTGALIVAGSFVVSAMPTIALLLAIIWYFICIINSAQGKAISARLKASFLLFRRMDKEQAQGITAQLQSTTQVIVANTDNPSVVIEPKGET